MMTFGSLFSGIGGIDLGLERAGWTCKWQVEIDPFCRKVLDKHWPHVKRYGDIKELTGDELDRVDLLAGGFPCQDLSLAGKGAGLAGERSGLWFEYLRIICALRPRWVFVENVPGLFVRGIDTVLWGLAEAGYDSTWFCLQAADFEAPHKRERVVVLAHSQCSEWGPGEPARYESDRENAGWPEASGGIGASNENGGAGNVAHAKLPGPARFRKHGRAGEETKERLRPGVGECSFDVADPCSQRLHARNEPRSLTKTCRGIEQGREFERVFTAVRWEQRPTESLLGRVLNGFSRGMDRYRWPAGPGEEQYEWEPSRVATGIKGRVPRLKGLGNAVVPAKAELIGWIIREVDENICPGAQHADRQPRP